MTNNENINEEITFTSNDLYMIMNETNNSNE